MKNKEIKENFENITNTLENLENRLYETEGSLSELEDKFSALLSRSALFKIGDSLLRNGESWVIEDISLEEDEKGNFEIYYEVESPDGYSFDVVPESDVQKRKEIINMNVADGKVSVNKKS